jgi:DNA/RNA-binding domain of Phe-tRNA-synthetase-like protein
MYPIIKNLDIHIMFFSNWNLVAHGKNIPNVSAVVEAMFMAELKNMLLTAGHDLEKIKLPLILKQSSGDESYTGINGKLVITVPGDIMIMDDESVISSILKGPDSKTRIGEKARQVLFTVYAPTGINENDIIRHLNDIESNIHVFSPDAKTMDKYVIGNF